MAKKFFWLKLKDDFFRSKEIKKLRRIAGGDTFTIIYLKLQLLSMNNDGILFYDETEDSLAEQLSLEIDEDIDNVKVTLSFLSANNLIEQVDENEFLLNKVPELIGKETDAAERMRKMRDKKLKELPNATEECNKVTHSCNKVTEQLQDVTQRKRKRKEIDIEIEKDINITSPKGVGGVVSEQVENVWKLYPRKRDKAKSIKKIPQLIKENSYEQMIRCVERYANEVKGADEKFIKYGSTFFNGGYMDYLDDEYTGGKTNGTNSECSKQLNATITTGEDDITRALRSSGRTLEECIGNWDESECIY